MAKPKYKTYRCKNTVITNGEVIVLDREDFANRNAWLSILRDLGFPVRETTSVLLEVVYARQYNDDEV